MSSWSTNSPSGCAPAEGKPDGSSHSGCNGGREGELARDYYYSRAERVAALAGLEAPQFRFDRVRDLPEALHLRAVIGRRQEERTGHFRLDKK